MGPNCPERFDHEFLSFCWSHQATGRLRARSLVERWSDKRETHILRLRAEVRRFLQQF
ncbi:hypothetical protein [Tropicibacter sp. Alg240-R139]|uniref:hypothetical protein n=1 Tax=Tropicibacter sp. Alg240-R139 TaxID=2305991 RepID=UPI0013DEB2E9|nr:hypothetical protein [Tropicibacter sp. Alg240-R139]